MSGKNKSFNANDKKIAQQIENMNLETANEVGIDGVKADLGYRKNNKQQGNFYKSKEDK